MTRWILAAGAAALAITTPALAQHGNGHGGGKAGDHGPKAEHQAKGQTAKVEHARAGAAMKAEHAVEHARVEHVGHGQAMKTEHATVRVRDAGEHGWQRDERQARAEAAREFVPRYGTHGLGKGLVEGCPPGLAAKHNGCLPPGQAKKLVGTTLATAYTRSMLSGPYRDWYRDDDRYLYRMGEDYIYRVDRGTNLISALIPSYDRDFSYYPVGQMYPSDFNYYNVPYQYQSYYPDGGNMLYRYGDGAIYGLNPQTQAVQSIVALLAGDLGVGQPLPMGYSAYNLPLQYRSQYYDTPNDWYRYNDGYIYRVDPKTQLITAVINALV